jgi:hypothetical protein
MWHALLAKGYYMVTICIFPNNKLFLCLLISR